jgi:N-acetylglucosaminyldiphosphoundecaprenol N-acetyl-beta-D-mannosaminyltransferase
VNPADSAAAPPAQVVDVFGLRVFSDDLARVPLAGPRRTIVTISPNSYGMSTRDAEFARALREADVVVLDGVYFGLASIALQGRTIRANQGPAVFHHFMRRLDAQGGRAFFLGASDDTLARIAARAARDYPRVQVGSFSPPYKPRFDAADSETMIGHVNAFAPDVLFVGMTAPKQEKWVHAHRARIDAPLAASIGAVFDWYAGNEPEVAPIWWKLRLVWLVRTIQRPEILKRYPNIAVFFWHLLLAVLRIKRFPVGTGCA